MNDISIAFGLFAQAAKEIEAESEQCDGFIGVDYDTNTHIRCGKKYGHDGECVS